MIAVRILRIPAACALLLLSSSTAAVADPFVIRSGVIQYSRSNQAVLSLTGTGFSASGVFGDGGSESWTPDHACFGCEPGTTMNVSITENMINDPGSFIGVSALLRQGTTDYSINALQFTITADPFTIPALTSGEATFGPVVPFLFSGNIAGHADGDTLEMALIGQGTVRVLFESNNWFETAFRFEDPAAIPEPGSLLLLGTGLAGLVARRRLKSRPS